MRVQAIVALVEAGDQTAAPLLIDRLEDEDPGVRLVAAQGLQRLTGESCDVEPWDTPERRAGAAAAQRRRWAERTAKSDE